MMVWIYVGTSKQVGDRDHLKVFATEDGAEKWFEDNDPTGVAFEYEVEGKRRREADMAHILVSGDKNLMVAEKKLQLVCDLLKSAEDADGEGRGPKFKKKTEADS